MPAHAPLTANKPLTPKQEAFAQAVAAGASGPEANRKAGYSGNPNVSRVEAFKRLMKPNIAKRVRELQAKHAKKFEVTAEGQFLKLEAAIKAAAKDKAHSAVMQGIGLQNRLFGLEKSSTELIIRRPARDPDAPETVELATEEWLRQHAPTMIETGNGFEGSGAGMFANNPAEPEAAAEGEVPEPPDAAAAAARDAEGAARAAKWRAGIDIGGDEDQDEPDYGMGLVLGPGNPDENA